MKCHYCDDFSTSSGLCRMHLRRRQRLGSATPLKKCFSCKEDFIWIGAAFNGNAHCDNCICLIKLYKNYIPRTDTLTAHKLSILDFIELLLNQNLGCALCFKPLLDSEIKIDHDKRCHPGHNGCSECVRGLLCHTCNIITGWVEKYPNIVEKSIIYKEIHPLKKVRK